MRRLTSNFWVSRSRVVTLVILTGLSATTAMGQTMLNPLGTTRSIDGQVRVMGHGPLPLDVTVRLEAAEDAYMAQQFVGSTGKFRFDGLGEGIYRLVVTAKGFQTVVQEVDTNWEASRTPTIYLVPLARKGSPQAGSPAVSATDLAAPKRARKEYEKGSRALESGNPKEAQEHLEKAVAEDPCYARAQTALGVALSLQREPAAAESAFDRAIKCDPGFVEAYVQMAVFLNSQARYKEAQTTLGEGLGRFPGEWRFHYQLGITLDGAHNYETAEKEFLKAQSIEPGVPPEFHLRLADVYLNWKKYDKAQAEMEAYLHAAPNGRFAERTRGLMRRMKSEGLLTSAQPRRDQK